MRSSDRHRPSQSIRKDNPDMKKIYLGDSVYVEFDGFAIILTTENGLSTDPSNRIVLESEVFNSLNLFAESLKQEVKL